MWRQMTIGKKIIFSFMITLLIMAGITTWIFISSGEILVNVSSARSKSQFAVLAQSMERDVVQVQQWLTDISATRGLDGLDDGFDEAAKSYESFLEGLGRFREMYMQAGADQSVREIDELKDRFDNYYEVGKQMASAYIKGGPELGNKTMADFDGSASALTEVLQPFIKEQIDSATTALGVVQSIINSFRRNVLVISVIMMVVLIALSMILTNYLTSRLTTMVSVIKEIASGDFTQKVDVQSGDEIGELADMINSMVFDLSVMFANISTNARTLAESTRQLSSISSELATGSEAMTNQALAVVSATEQMSSNINSVASAVEQSSVNASTVSSTAEQMSANMDAIASAINNITKSIEEVSQNTRETSKIASKATELSDTATSSMKTLGSSADEIGKVTEMIKNIAEQTNLLALNATIEAASAGEAGKGFAVVANEIKELANQSAQAAEEITSKIEGMQASTGGAITVISDVSEIISRINDSVIVISGAINHQTELAHQITSNVAEVTAGSINIASSIAEVAKGSSEISRNVGEAAQGANGVATNISSISKSVDASHASINQIDSSVGDLAKVSSELESMVSRFKIDTSDKSVKQLTAAG